MKQQCGRRKAAEKAKIELSSTTQTKINLPFITANAYGLKGYVTSVKHYCGRCEAAEKAEIEVSSTTQTEINLPFITADAYDLEGYAYDFGESLLWPARGC